MEGGSVMGEYETVGGHEVKLGTCEDFYYLRWDQRLAPADVEGRDAFRYFTPDVLEVVRFRFPWPDEDGTPAGGFAGDLRGLTLWGFEQPAEVDHGTVQF